MPTEPRNNTLRFQFLTMRAEAHGGEAIAVMARLCRYGFFSVIALNVLAAIIFVTKATFL